MPLKKLRRKLARHSVVAKWGGLFSAIAGGLLLILLVIFPVLGFLGGHIFSPKNPVGALFTGPSPLKSDNGRVNFLLLGIGDQSHDGPNLTDTMILISTPASGSGTIYLVSIPRDIYLDDLQGKVNSAYADGQDKQPPAGLALAKAAVTEVTGLPVHYSFRIDFSGFAKVIDILGGVDVEVENTFDDYYYPIDGKENETCGISPEEAAVREATNSGEPSFIYSCRYEHLHFDKGPTHMDGVTALKYVRSRHAQGLEGTDFARSKRQQRLITAIKTKALSIPNLLSVTKMLSIYNTLKDHTDTDIDLSQATTFISFGLKLKGNTIKSIPLDNTILVNPPIDQRGWILTAPDGGWDKIHNYIQSQMDQ